MSKVAEYLQEHILGEVVTSQPILAGMSHDASVLEIAPEMVIYPKVTNDIRKAARFAWQLAEKGHILPLTVRGGGTDTTGGAIGAGAIISTKAHMNNILEFDAKQKLLRVQPGLELDTLSTALSLQGMGIPPFACASQYGTVGGAIGKNSNGLHGYASLSSWVNQLEVVLANGDILQTERLNKRDLNKKKGLQTFEGEIYRSLDNLIEDNKQLIDEQIGYDSPDVCGYGAIAKIKQRDGSFDLTPLFLGSQGTLGIISEMIIRCDFMSMHSAVSVATFTSKEAARDALDQLRSFEPAYLEYYDGDFFDIAGGKGKKYSFYPDMDGMLKAVIVLGFTDFSERARHKKLKKLAKFLDKLDISYTAADGEDAEALKEAMEVTSFIAVPSEKGASAPPLLDGAYIPAERFEEFSNAVTELAVKHHTQLPIHLNALTNTVNIRPTLYLQKVGDKQKIFKLLDEYGVLVSNHSGSLVGVGSEGRVKARFAYAGLEAEIRDLYMAVKEIFDPYKILNPGVKDDVEIRELVARLRKDYDRADFKDEVPHF